MTQISEYPENQKHQESREIFTLPASEAAIQHVAKKLQERNMEVVIVDDGEQARSVVLGRLPQGAEVHSARSKTLEDTGIYAAIHDTGHYAPLRHQYTRLNRRTQARAIRKLVASPDYILGSVNAITHDGVMIVASASASQLGPYANTAGQVILVVGSQKIVPDLETALQRIRGYALEKEDRQVRDSARTETRGNQGAFVGKILIIEREWIDERILVVLVRQPIGI